MTAAQESAEVWPSAKATPAPALPMAAGSASLDTQQSAIMSTPRFFMTSVEEKMTVWNQLRQGTSFLYATQALLKGQRFTEDQAALVLQAYVRGYAERSKLKETQTAAITIQSNYRGISERKEQQKQAEAAARVQATYRGKSIRSDTDLRLQEYRAATKLQANWRGHVARNYAKEERSAQNHNLTARFMRTFSKRKQSTYKATYSIGTAATASAPQNGVGGHTSRTARSARGLSSYWSSPEHA